MAGNKPVTIGHQLSTVALLAEWGKTASPWGVSLATRRVEALPDQTLVGAGQIDPSIPRGLMGDQRLPLHGQLCVEVADTTYSKPAYLAAYRHDWNLVTITRLHGNRTLYRPATPTQERTRAGHPTWYGDRFSLRNPGTWHPPDERSSPYELRPPPTSADEDAATGSRSSPGTTC